MVKQKVTYINFDGEEITETIRFNLTKAELMRLEARSEGGLSARLDKIQKAMAREREETESEEIRDPLLKKEIFDFFEEVIESSYGIVRNGMFVKDKDATSQFMASEAYSELLLSLLSGGESTAAAFIQGIMPPVKQEVAHDANH